jgi:hypothetical protein
VIKSEIRVPNPNHSNAEIRMVSDFGFPSLSWSLFVKIARVKESVVACLLMLSLCGASSADELDSQELQARVRSILGAVSP